MEKKLENTKNSIITWLIVSFAIFAFLFYGMHELACVAIAVSAMLWYDVKMVLPVVAIPALYCTLLANDSVLITSAISMAACGAIVGIMMRNHAPNRIVFMIGATLQTVAFYLSFMVESNTKDISIIELATDSMGIPAQFAYASMIAGGILLGAFLMLSIRLVYALIGTAIYGKKLFKLKDTMPLPFLGLSKNFTIGMAVAAVAVVLINVLNLNNAQAISYAVTMIFAVPLCLQGMCFFIFLVYFRFSGGSFGRIIAMCFLLAITFPIGVLVLGLAEQFMRTRSKVIVLKKYENTNADDGSNLKKSKDDENDTHKNDSHE